MGKRGPKPKTIAERKADGTRIQKDRHAGRIDSVHIGGLPDPQLNLTDRQSRFYSVLVDNMPKGVLTSIDTMGMEELLRWYEVYSVLMDKLQESPSDPALMTQTKKAFDSFFKIADRYGWTPGARADIKLPEGYQESDPQADIIARMAG